MTSGSARAFVDVDAAAVAAALDDGVVGVAAALWRARWDGKRSASVWKVSSGRHGGIFGTYFGGSFIFF